MRLWFCIASCFVLCSHEYGGGVLGTFVVLHLGSRVHDSLGVFWWWFFARLWFCILVHACVVVWAFFGGGFSRVCGFASFRVSMFLSQFLYI